MRNFDMANLFRCQLGAGLIACGIALGSAAEDVATERGVLNEGISNQSVPAEKAAVPILNSDHRNQHIEADESCKEAVPDAPITPALNTSAERAEPVSAEKETAAVLNSGARSHR